MKKANFFWLGISVIISFIANWIRAVRWNLLIEPLGKKPSVANSFFAVNICYLANLALPRMGEITRCGVLAKNENIAIRSLLGTIIAERIVDLFCLFILLFFTIIFQMNILKDFFFNTIAETFGSNTLGKIFSLTFLYTLAGLAVVVVGLFILFFKKIRETKFYLRAIALIIGMWEGVKTIKQMKHNGLFLFQTIVIWFLYFLTTYICTFSIEPTSNLGAGAALAATVFGGLGISAPVQGGIGAYHWIVAQTLVMYGIPKSEGLIFATIVHATQMVIIVVSGFVSLLLIPYFNKKKSV